MESYKRIILIIVVIIFNNIVSAQELIKNGDFENYNKIPPILFNNIKGWYKPTWASTDFYYKPFIWNGQKTKAYSGESFIGLVLFSNNYDYAEYATSKLISKLENGTLYCLSMYVMLSNATYSAPINLDVKFTKKRIKHLTKKTLSKKYIVDIPHLGKSYISNIGFWEKKSVLYKASGNEKYLTIGLFTQIKKYIQLKDNNGIYGHNYVLIDSVSLRVITDSTQCNCNKIRKDFTSIETGTDSLKEEKPLMKTGLIVKFNKLHFATNSSEIDTTSIQELKVLIRLLKADTSLNICINGHTDSKGYDKRNINLSKQRAKAVVNYLVLQGIAQDRLKHKGYGSSYPLATNMTEEGRAINRRVEFEVIEHVTHKRKTN